ncbi:MULTISPECIES: hypothetical protein [Stenotrophomonas maltophilia group]|uniref:hypothetical protein n=1 Tax=Stenotrophomonas maltophilia group TaxID=995085 RepID=UPI001E3598AC|nr:hypothetical protein [Stenotrophomonas maltophilia]UGB21450.1 hypothetical protein LQ335_19765 [Stenotrophomonas maltophilia]
MDSQEQLDSLEPLCRRRTSVIETPPTLEEFMKAGNDFFRASPFFLRLTKDEDPSDTNWVLGIIFLRWLARNHAFLDVSVGSTVAAAPSPTDTLACIEAAFQDEIPGTAFDPELLEFTVRYFCMAAPYFSDFFSLFPQDAMPSPDAMWDKQEEVYAIIDSRLRSWRNGEPLVRAVLPMTDQQGDAEPATPLDADVWISTLATLSDAAVTHEGCCAYADHFYTPLTKPASVEVVLAVMKEFLRNPPHDASVMCAAENFLSDIPFSRYVKAYSILAPDLLDASSDAALNLFNYPGCELTPRQVRQFIKKLRRCNPERDVVGELAQLAIAWNSEDDETFSIVIEAAQKQG